MQNLDSISDAAAESTPKADMNSNPDENDFSTEFKILLRRLEHLYSDQNDLNVLSRHLARRTSQISELSDSGQLDENSLFATLNSTASPSEEETSEKIVHPKPWIEYVSIGESPDDFSDRMLDVKQIDGLPPMQSRCNSSHWKSLLKAASNIENALLYISPFNRHASIKSCFPVVETSKDKFAHIQDESERLEAEVSHRIAQSRQKDRDKKILETDGFYLRQLQRELEPLARLARCAATLCSVLSDFNAANIKVDDAPTSNDFFFVRVSRAIAWYGKSLDETSDRIESSSDFLARYIENNPKASLKASEIEDVTRFCRKVREDAAADQSNKLFTPREIGKYFLDRNPDTVRSLIAEMEKDEIERPYLKGSNGLYTKKQGIRMIQFYENKRRHWRK